MNRLLSICLLLQGSAALAEKPAAPAAEVAPAEKPPVTVTFTGTFVSAEDNGQGMTVNLKDKAGKAFIVLLDPGQAALVAPAAGASVEVVYRPDTFDTVKAVRLLGKSKPKKGELVGVLENTTNGDMGLYLDVKVDGEKDPRNIVGDFEAVTPDNQVAWLHKKVALTLQPETKNWYVSHKVLGAAPKAPKAP
jgi:hypothetical protein